MVGKKCIGYDGRGYKYYYFPWVMNKFFIRVNIKDNKDFSIYTDCRLFL